MPTSTNGCPAEGEFASTGKGSKVQFGSIEAKNNMRSICNFRVIEKLTRLRVKKIDKFFGIQCAVCVDLKIIRRY